MMERTVFLTGLLFFMVVSALALRDLGDGHAAHGHAHAATHQGRLYSRRRYDQR